MKPRTLRILAAAGVVGLALSACAPTVELQTAEVPQASQAVIAADFLGTSEVDFRNPLQINAQQGRMTSVVVTDPSGAQVPGAIVGSGAAWEIPARSLAMGTTYNVQASAVDRFGTATTTTSTFTTMLPENVNNFTFSLSDGSTYGVGMPVSVRFDKPVSDRAAVEKLLQVTTSVPVEGSWNWVGQQTVTYRPKDYWPAGVKVNVAANLRGVETEPDLFVLDNKAMAFDVGSSMVAVVDAATHQMTVKRDGAVVRTIPITTGKPGWDTRSGVKVIMSKERHVVMDASTLGVDKEDPEYYRLDVDYALRLTSSGEFVHAAPWSVASQGVENVSHGCVGMSTDNAAWFFNNAKVGDIVQVVNTGRPQNAGNGITVWNVPWETWRAGSALAAAPA